MEVRPACGAGDRPPQTATQGIECQDLDSELRAVGIVIGDLDGIVLSNFNHGGSGLYLAAGVP
ncbi:hypothetical protein GCM10010357_07150 [Streptomyces luteireticuli]|uniref:Uncharacterized protein n=1 Tax=Streptomyces luteireticuli TaxID=173858 RepID=A0ABP3I311_9ACTN